ncbi:MAG: DUF1343 domain-containing protein [Bacteroidetes bacterium]|nr:DUF1343 domain-containing protein [Bacteroidota bacterium]
MNLRIVSITIILITTLFLLSCKNKQLRLVEDDDIICGSARIELYLPDLLNQKVAVVANQSSMIGDIHLVDSLLSQGINVKKIFCPEHGFRGRADAGEKIVDDFDAKTNIPIISLYGSHKKPTPVDLDSIDVVIFDLQDVGTRFYTYISTLTYVMEACAEQDIPIIVLDRPNPNGYFVDGPIMEKEYSSFVGLHPVPVVYGMTIGEYAKMVVGERWINQSDSLDLKVIPLEGYNHNMIVKLKIKPSPNLPNWQSVYLYPSICFFEGTVMSVGRGTEFPFQVYGHPEFNHGSFIFTPTSTQGALKPLYNGEQCCGANLSGYAENYKKNEKTINLSWLIGAHEIMSRNGEYFINYFEKLAGTSELRKQISVGLSEDEIRKTWQPGIDNFLKIRSKYLLYE